jgi:hypothetical protein
MNFDDFVLAKTRPKYRIGKITDFIVEETKTTTQPVINQVQTPRFNAFNPVTIQKEYLENNYS